MTSVLAGFATIWFVVAAGWVAARVHVVDESAQVVLTRVSFFIGSPALLFMMMSTADVHRVFAGSLVACLVATLVVGAAYVVLARLVWRRPAGHTVIGWFCSCYVNSNYMGLPIATYVLHDASWIAPVMLVQVGVLQPAGLMVLDRLTSDPDAHRSRWSNVLLPVRNPMTVGTLLGLAMNLLHWRVPALLADPLNLLGQLAVPCVLVAFGVSLCLGPRPGRGDDKVELATITALKLLAQPAIAASVGALAGLDPKTLFAAAVIAGLPTAQNIFGHAVRYGQAVPLARDVVFLTSVLSIPTITLIALIASP